MSDRIAGLILAVIGALFVLVGYHNGGWDSWWLVLIAVGFVFVAGGGRAMVTGKSPSEWNKK